jgi:putative acetyltransferase
LNKNPIDTDTIIRPIEAADNSAVANIIRQVMTEFGAVGCGYSINDPEVDDMFDAYNSARAAFYVIENSGQILGCAGYAALTGGDEDICELRKMYFLPEARGQGLGSEMMRLCLQEARSDGFKRCYLETTNEMAAARKAYQNQGFRDLDGPMGATGHSACGRWMLLEL